MHAHRYSWHNIGLFGFDAVEMVNRLNSERIMEIGYLNLRCEHDPGCPKWLHPYEGESMTKQEQDILASCWHELFPLNTLPRVLAQPCCAQFAVSRYRLVGISLTRFVYYRDWLLRTDLTDYYSGR